MLCLQKSSRCVSDSAQFLLWQERAILWLRSLSAHVTLELSVSVRALFRWAVTRQLTDRVKRTCTCLTTHAYSVCTLLWVPVCVCSTYKPVIAEKYNTVNSVKILLHTQCYLRKKDRGIIRKIVPQVSRVFIMQQKGNCSVTLFNNVG